MRALADRLGRLSHSQLKPGPLKGLLFNNPKRFVVDLAYRLRLQAGFLGYVAASELGRGCLVVCGQGNALTFAGRADRLPSGI
jgi:hypothetical protein